MFFPSGWCAVELGPYGDKARTVAMRTGIESIGGKVVPMLRVKSKEQLPAGTRFAFTSGHHPAQAFERGLFRFLGLPMIVTDLGYVRRSKGPLDVEGYCQVGVDRLNWLPPVTGIAAPDRLEALGISFQRPRLVDDPKRLLVLSQVPNDSNHGLDAAQLNTWLTERAAARGDHEVLHRPHPKSPWFKFGGPDIRWVDPEETSLSENFSWATRVLTYNSTAGLDAVIAGLPVDCHPEALFAQFGTKLSEADFVDLRRILFARISYAQWTLEEIAQAMPLMFFRALKKL